MRAFYQIDIPVIDPFEIKQQYSPRFFFSSCPDHRNAYVFLTIFCKI